jgi:hypothetical protein
MAAVAPCIICTGPRSVSTVRACVCEERWTDHCVRHCATDAGASTGAEEDFVFKDVWFEDGSGVDNGRHVGLFHGRLVGGSSAARRLNISACLPCE